MSQTNHIWTTVLNSAAFLFANQSQKILTQNNIKTLSFTSSTQRPLTSGRQRSDSRALERRKKTYEEASLDSEKKSFEIDLCSYEKCNSKQLCSTFWFLRDVLAFLSFIAWKRDGSSREISCLAGGLFGVIDVNITLTTGNKVYSCHHCSTWMSTKKVSDQVERETERQRVRKREKGGGYMSEHSNQGMHEGK